MSNGALAYSYSLTFEGYETAQGRVFSVLNDQTTRLARCGIDSLQHMRRCQIDAFVRYEERGAEQTLYKGLIASSLGFANRNYEVL